jgi:CPA1 family monovalent cation:H+ antiporter
MSATLTQFDAVLNILLVVTVITLITRKLRFPHTIALIFAGIYSTFITRFPFPKLEPEIFISILLPPILFQETLHLDVYGFVDESDTILSYAVFGTIAMVLSIFFFSWFVLGLDIIESFLLGIIIAPTDPVAVIGTFQRMGVLKKFQLLVAGESILNDGVAIVIYSILVSIVTLGSFSVIGLAIDSIVAIVGGLLLGILGGYFAHILFCWTEDKFAEALISFIIAFGVFRVAEELGASGVLATVLAGLILNYRCRTYGGLGEPSIEMLNAMWEFVGFIAQSIAFIFIGMNTDPVVLYEYLWPIISLTLFILFARYFMVLAVSGFLKSIKGKIVPTNWKLAMTWSGLRGGVSVVLALGVSGLHLLNIEKIVALTFGIVLLSNVFQGVSISMIVQKSNLSAINNQIRKDKKRNSETSKG